MILKERSYLIIVVYAHRSIVGVSGVEFEDGNSRIWHSLIMSSNKDDKKKNSNMIIFAMIGGFVGFIFGASVGIGGMIWMGICGASIGAFFADQFWNKWKISKVT